MGTNAEVRIGSLVAAAGLIWTVKIATANFTGVEAFGFSLLPRGPLEVCAVGILIWLHAKWRKSVHLR